MRRQGVVIVAISMVVLFAWAGAGVAGPRLLRVDMEGGADGNGPWLDLILHEVRVTPIVAHVGDMIRFEMVLENHGDPIYTTTTIDIKANGKVVASKLFSFGLSNESWKMYRETLQWDTKGVMPGKYRIEGEAFVWGDSYEFDNYLKVKKPLVLLPVGAAMPAGMADGGTAVAEQ